MDEKAEITAEQLQLAMLALLWQPVNLYDPRNADVLKLFSMRKAEKDETWSET